MYEVAWCKMWLFTIILQWLQGNKKVKNYNDDAISITQWCNSNNNSGNFE